MLSDFIGGVDLTVDVLLFRSGDLDSCGRGRGLFILRGLDDMHASAVCNNGNACWWLPPRSPPQPQHGP
jgi:hypothetical protein